MLIDAKHDQKEFGKDAGEYDPDHQANEAAQDREQAGKRMQRHERETGYDAGKREQNRHPDREPVKDLDDRRRDEPIPLKQVPIIENQILLAANALSFERWLCMAAERDRFMEADGHCTGADEWSIELVQTRGPRADRVHSGQAFVAYRLD